MFHRILVPLDGSSLSEPVLAAAAHIARSAGAQLDLLRVVPLPVTYSPYTITTLDGTGPVAIEPSQEHALNYLCRLADMLACEGVAATSSIEVGMPGPAILDAVMALHADLVVMGMYGRSGGARWVLGSDVERVVRYSPAPVLLVRPNDAGASESRGDRASRVRLLVPLGGSALAETALDPAITLGCALSGTGRCALHLLSVVDPRAAVLDCIPEPVAIGRAEGYLAGVVARLEAAHTSRLAVPVTTSVVVTADVAGGIIRTAEGSGDEGDANSASLFDLVAMATHARGGLTRWTLGSVTERLLRDGRLPLLIVRPVANAAAVEAAALAW